AWEQHGWGSPGATAPGIYWSRRDRHPSSRKDLAPGAGRAITESLGGGVWCAVPTSLWADSAGSLPRARAARWEPGIPRPAGWSPSGHDRATRLASVMLCWNVLEHFYPYHDVVKADWPGALEQALTAAAADRDDPAYLITLQRMIARLEDGHGFVTG